MDEDSLKTGNSEDKRIVINKLVNFGINITPSMLDLILNLDKPLEKIPLIVKELSFLPSFNGHLSKDSIGKISNEELLMALKRVMIHEKKSLIESDSNKSLINKDNNVKTPNRDDLQNSTLKNTNSYENDIKIKSSLIEKEQIPQVIMKNEGFNENLSKDEIKIKYSGSAKSSLTFSPIAKNYSADYEILKDPTGKLYTSGSYENFYEMTTDKFNRLQDLMRKRSDVLSFSRINNICRNSVKQDISTIGLVKEIRLTKNNNYFITIEDLTGLINIIVRDSSANEDIFKKARLTIPDQMIYIEGTYNPGEKGKRGIVFANNLLKIDVRKDFTPNRSPDPLSIALISDIHIGSREFEEKLWNKFIDFLNGKMGSKTSREMAGKIKYIIINGDLVDGIGVYPKQEEDLVISDIYQQFEKASALLSKIPDYIKIFYSSGNHDPVRNAIPRPAVPKKYTEDLLNLGVKCLGNPSIVQTHKVNTLIFHGDSLLDLNMMIPKLKHDKPVKTMEELLKCRHLAPIFGRRTQIAPTEKDWLVIDQIPDIFHTGHIHINGIGYYNNGSPPVLLANSGCFQSQTDFMKSLGIIPTPGIVNIINLDSLKYFPLDLNNY
jgi:DNA polymerase II small subunit